MKISIIISFVVSAFTSFISHAAETYSRPGYDAMESCLAFGDCEQCEAKYYVKCRAGFQTSGCKFCVKVEKSFDSYQPYMQDGHKDQKSCQALLGPGSECVECGGKFYPKCKYGYEAIRCKSCRPVL